MIWPKVEFVKNETFSRLGPSVLIRKKENWTDFLVNICWVRAPNFVCQNFSLLKLLLTPAEVAELGPRLESH